VLDLDKIKGELLSQLRSESKFSFVNTRLILKTGISLRDYNPQEAHDPAVVAKVLDVLAEQGFTLKRG
jgi:hypothetical protein